LTNESILVSAGEVSGDHYLARIVPSLRNMGFDGRLYGMCGEESVSAGVETVWRNERLHLMGIVEVIGAIRGVLELIGEMYAEVMRSRPAAVVVVDSPDFHLPLIRRLRRGGYSGKIVYVSPPSVWAWRSYRVRTLARCVDLCLPLFHFEHDYLSRHGCRSVWMGHPLVEELADQGCRPLSGLGIQGRGEGFDDNRMIALLPGSRRMEIKNLYAALSRAYDILTERGYSPVFSLAPGLSDGARSLLMSNIDAECRAHFEGPGRDLMAASLMVIGSSGTATAEALLLRRYMVVMYRLSPMSAVIGKLLLPRVRFAIPNILAGDEFYPELLQRRATGEAAAAEALAWLEADESVRSGRLSRMEELVGLMGGGGVYGSWSGLILEEAR
jgi:lipid-A-disaccharide synthase